ncbi:MAG: DUF4175 domain-containing protein [Chloroflexi bacterium]|nr:DUF4175 domain-containing protein [Chloroflexota bacterium]
MKKLLILLGALSVWLLAIVGAIALALWLRLFAHETRLLVIAVAFVAFLGAFLPIARLTAEC